MDTNKILEELDNYFKNTPKKEIEATWAKVEKKCEGIDSPTIEEYMEFLNNNPLMKEDNQNK
jgi:ribonucleotide reductase beta subunit family protein with ferritin-like domain